MKPAYQRLLQKRHALIPGAAHTYSKGDDQFPVVAPKAIVKGKGCYVWADDGKKYLDWCMGLRSVSLGHAYPVVNRAVQKQIEMGTNFGRPALIEFVLADFLIKLLPNVDMVKFAKNGSTVTTAATKLARAYTGRKLIAVCASHAFFSYDDWFIGTTACDAGIPEEIKKLTVTFTYNDIASVEKMFADRKNEIACLIMEVVTTEEPKDNFLAKVQALCKANGTVFILDEMVTGFRWHLKGAAHKYGLTPDLVTYGKGIANGYSLAVLGGRKEIMELGGLQHKKERVFLISTTHGAETTALAAAMATIGEMKSKHVHDHFWKIGTLIQKEFAALAKKFGMEKQIELIGFAPNLLMSVKDKDGNPSLFLKTVFLQEVIKRGILFQGAFPVSFSHKEAEVKKTFAVLADVMPVFVKICNSKNPEKHLIGEPIKPVFRKYN